MKIQKYFLALIILTVSNIAFAHCPSAYNPEKVCMMFEKDLLYIYDHKLEHNGPYKDLEKAQVTGMKTLTGEKLSFKKLARGIFKVDVSQKKGVMVEISLDKKVQTVKVAHE